MEVDSPVSPAVAAKKAKPSDQGSEEVRQFPKILFTKSIESSNINHNVEYIVKCK